MNRLLSLLLVGLTSSLQAQSGAELYKTYCAACHGPQGEGVAGAAPPLAHSGWVAGDPARMVQIILYGLQGKIKVLGEDYNLIMPPQVALNEKQVAEVTNFVRGRWGNTGKEIDEDYVKEIKSGLKPQAGMWQGKRLLKEYPLTNQPTKIKQLLSESHPYSADIENVGKTPAKAVEEEQSGLISPTQVGKPNRPFSAIWKGQLTAPEAGDYTFSFNTDSVASLAVNEQVIIQREKPKKGNAPEPMTATVSLPKGPLELEVKYTHERKTAFLFQLFWSGSTFHQSPLHDSQKVVIKKVSHVLIPPPERALIHRNFFSQPAERAMAVGFSTKTHFLFSVDDLSVESMWGGGFLDVGKTWDGRARGEIAKPYTAHISKIDQECGYKILKKTPSKWAEATGAEREKSFKGFQYDKKGNPTLMYAIDGIELQDYFSSTEEGVLKRVLTVQNVPKGESLYYRLSDKKLSPSKDQKKSFQIDENLSVNILGAVAEPLFLPDGVVIPLSESTPLTLEYFIK